MTHPCPVVAAVVARCDSRRLPGKVLSPVGSRRLIDYVLARLQRAAHIDKVMVATSDRRVDDPLAAHAANRGVAVFRGAADDVAGRLLACARATAAGLLLRVNADSPWVDPNLLDRGVVLARTSGSDLVSNLPGRTYPYGIAVEVLRPAALARAYPHMGAEDREHVTAHLYAHPERYTITTFTAPRPCPQTPRLVVDTADDLAAFAAAAAALGGAAAMADPAQVLHAYPKETTAP